MKEDMYGNALQLTSWKGYLHVVLKLLELGANPNAQEGEFGNALQAACYGNHGDVIKIRPKQK